MKLTNVFLQLVDMSIAASYVVAAVVILRFLLKKFPKWLHCALWAMVAVRMICPVSVESPVSVVAAEPAKEAAREVLDDYVGASHTYWDHTDEYRMAVDAGVPVIQAEEEGAYVVTGETPQENPTVLADILAPVWIGGMVILVIYASVTYWKIRKSVAASIHLSENLYLCDYIDTPFILGIIRPKIYLPSSMDPNAASHVLAHERAHIQRRDHWWKPLGYALLCVHWFNPVIWIAYILLCRDIEMACDERVVREMSVPDKKAYSEALLSCSVSRRMIAACPLAFGEVGVKQRVKSVLHYKKPGFWILLLAVLLCAVAAVSFVTDPVAESDIAKAFDIEEKSATEFGLRSDYGMVTLSTDREMEAVYSLLNSVELSLEPLSGEAVKGNTDEYGWAYPALQICIGEENKYLYFSSEFDAVWLESDEGRTVPYGVENPEIMVDFFQKYSAVVFSREVEYHPFAYADKPWLWTQNISLDAVEALRYYCKNDNGSTGGGPMSQVRFEELVNILHQIPENAISEGELKGANYSYTDLFINRRAEEKSAVWIEDGANRMVVVLRMENGTVQMIFCPEYEEAKESYNKIKDIKVWKIENETLREYLQEMDVHSPGVSVFVGSEFAWERVPVTVSGEEVTITARIIKGWESEVVSPEAGDESYGIRCRPADAEEGWLYFSFWPNGFELVEEDRYYSIIESGEGESLYSYPSQVYQNGNLDMRGYQWSYHRIRTPMGDYVVLLENAESWSERYWDAIDTLNVITERTFRGTKVSCGNMSLELPYPWIYEIVEDGGTGDSFGIRFKPTGLEGWLYLSCQPTPFAVCGTGLETQPVTYENGLTGLAGYYDGSETWSYIRLEGLKQEYVLLNEDASYWVPACQKEIADIMGSLQITENSTVTAAIPDTPLQWLQSVKQEHIITCVASLYEEMGYSHPIEGSELEELITLLNGVEETQVIARQPDGADDPLWDVNCTRIHLYLHEDVSLLLRYTEDTLILTPETDSGIWETDGYWTVENDALKQWMENLSYGGTWMLTDENREEVRQLLRMNFVEFFDPQMTEDMLYVGCSYDYGRGLGIACFQMDAEGDYELLRVIRDGDIKNCESGAELYCCSFEDWQLFLVMNRSVTGIQELVGNTLSKHPIDRHPAVVILRKPDLEARYKFVYGTGGGYTMYMDASGKVVD